MALLPGHSVEQGGDDEERAEPRPIHPGWQSLPLVLRPEMQQQAAEQAGDYPQLKDVTSGVRSERQAAAGWTAKTFSKSFWHVHFLYHYWLFFPEWSTSSVMHAQVHTHRMRRTVGCMLVFRGLVSLVRRNAFVHKSETQKWVQIQHLNPKNLKW